MSAIATAAKAQNASAVWWGALSPVTNCFGISAARVRSGAIDPVRMSQRSLLDRQREQRKTDNDHEPKLEPGRSPGAGHEPYRLGHQKEDREVVGAERQHRDDRPAPPLASPCRFVCWLPDRQVERQTSPERQERIGTGLLRVPDQKRIERGEGPGREAGSGAAKLAARPIDDTHTNAIPAIADGKRSENSE